MQCLVSRRFQIGMVELQFVVRPCHLAQWGDVPHVGTTVPTLAFTTTALELGVGHSLQSCV